MERRQPQTAVAVFTPDWVGLRPRVLPRRKSPRDGKLAFPRGQEPGSSLGSGYGDTDRKTDRVHRGGPLRVPSPDGKTIVTGSADARMPTGEVRFWNRATGAPIGRANAAGPRGRRLAFSRDGRMLLTGTADYVARKGELQLWEAATRKPVGPSIIIQAGLSQVAVSPDGRTILTASGMYGQPSYLWELPADRLIGRPLLHQETLSAVAFSPDGKMIVTGTGKPSKRGAAQALGWSHRPSDRPTAAPAWLRLGGGL